MSAVLKNNERLTRLGIKCLIMLVLFVVALAGAVYPVYSRVQELDQNIAAMESKLAQQQVYLPLYARLKGEASKEPALNLPVPGGVPLERGKALGIVVDIENMAHDSNMDTLDISVDQAAIRSGLGHVKITGIFAGQSVDFRNFYVSLGALPYVDAIPKIEMRAVPNGLEVYMELSVLIKK